jgi:formate dehydrogenase maturation protein FdhE
VDYNPRSDWIKMSKNAGRSVQHKQTEESKNKIIAELKKENHTLQRKVAKLQKYLQKALDSSTFVKEDKEDIQEASSVPENVDGCPVCGSNEIASLKVPSGSVIKMCKNCTWRKKE